MGSSVFQAAFETVTVDRYQALFRVSQTLISNRCPEELLKVLARELREVVNFYYLGIGVYNEATHEVRLKTFDESGSPIHPPKLAPEETMTWWVYQRQQPLVIPSVDDETRFPMAVGFLEKLGIRSICTLPLTTMHRRLGALAVGSKELDAYSEDEIRFLTLVANQVALAIDDALNFKASASAQDELKRKQAELQRERDRLQLLLDVTNQVISNLEIRDLLRSISASIRRVMECDGAGVLLPDCEGRQLQVYALDFPESKGLISEEKLIPIENSVPGAAFQTGKPLVKNHSGAPGKDCEAADVVAREGIKCCCFIPLLSRNRSVGVLALARLGETIFTEDEVGFLTQVASQVAIAVENACAFHQIAVLKDQLAQEKLYLEDEIRSELNFEEIIGESPALRRVLGQVETVAPTDSTVLIYGETGTGKELIARAIHNLSTRRSNAFVKLNCAAIPTGLLESELFGHERGAFTGAVAQRVGRFELAHRGTIFLDEIGEIPLELQPKLLRVLQEREFERLGSTRTLHSDARLIAATNRNLAALVEKQKFRADLFYRLNVFPVHIPPLRERPEDVPSLVRHFAQQFSRKMNKTIRTIPAETMNALTRYHWPGNVRELQNVIERAVILSKGPALNVALADLKRRAPDARPETKDTLEEAERKHIQAVLEETNWVVGGMNGAAARLGLNRSTLQFRMRKLGLTRPGR
ncbi:MAG TPA: sigma 54-interacting transcriptional regulator [Terriglobia bacterium]|nr:sigma 54-interacting transcriptional regulator [Terriglobia bacterium]